MKLTRMIAAAGIVVAATVGGAALAAPATAASVAADYPPARGCSVTVTATNLQPGSTITITVTGCGPNLTIIVQIASTPTTIATGTTNAQGNATLTGTVPTNIEPGTHTITVQVGSATVFTAQVTVRAASGGGGSGSGSSGGGVLASTGAAVTGIGILGAGLVAGGVFFVLAGRKRDEDELTTEV